jgi:hypothetical protein
LRFSFAPAIAQVGAIHEKGIPGRGYANQGLITPVNRPRRNKDRGSKTRIPLIVVLTEGVIFGGVSSETWGAIFIISIALGKFYISIFDE